MSDYSVFKTKQIKPVVSGFDVDDAYLNKIYFDFQKAIVRWH